MAISSIPSYISQSFFFVILIPAVRHEDGRILSFESWAERGWCRLESMARSLSREDGFMITVKVASNPTLTTDLGVLARRLAREASASKRIEANVGQFSQI